MLKADFDQFPSDKIFETLSNTEILKFLSDNNVFINDIDFTQGFRGLIEKEEVITWLLINRKFRAQESYDLATHTILDNDFKISRNCLTFIKQTKNGDIRYKVFKKIF